MLDTLLCTAPEARQDLRDVCHGHVSVAAPNMPYYVRAYALQIQ